MFVYNARRGRALVHNEDSLEDELGAESEGGCSGHACLLGSCFCSRGFGGEWCEHRPAKRVACESEEKQAYAPLATGLKRHTAHDACAFYSGPYGTMAVDARRWEAAQVGGRHMR